MQAAGVEVTLHEARDMPHNAPFFAAFHPEAQAAHDRIVEFVRAKLG